MSRYETDCVVGRQLPDEDRDVAAAAREVAKGHAAGTLPEFIGLRVKPLTEELRARSLRTLRLFVATLLESAGTLPANFIITLPKITAPTLLIAALGPAMLKLAAERADGTVTWMTGPRTLGEFTVPTLAAAAEAWPHRVALRMTGDRPSTATFAELARLWRPLLDLARDSGLCFTYELHPGSDVYDGATFEAFLERADGFLTRDIKRHDHVRKHDDVAQRKDREQLLADCLVFALHGFAHRLARRPVYGTGKLG